MLWGGLLEPTAPHLVHQPSSDSGVYMDTCCLLPWGFCSDALNAVYIHRASTQTPILPAVYTHFVSFPTNVEAKLTTFYEKVNTSFAEEQDLLSHLNSMLLPKDLDRMYRGKWHLQESRMGRAPGATEPEHKGWQLEEGAPGQAGVPLQTAPWALAELAPGAWGGLEGSRPSVPLALPLLEMHEAPGRRS